jgi:hypothetical protein
MMPIKVMQMRSPPPAWSPLLLPGSFAAYDPTDPTTLWQDAARTVPVTAQDDPVWTIDDITGNGHHLYAPNSTGRGLWQEGLGIENDGLDDWYIEVNSWSSTLPIYQACAYTRGTDIAARPFFTTRGNSTQIGEMRFAQTGAASFYQAIMRCGGSTYTFGTPGGSWLAGETHVADMLHIGGTCALQIDNESEVTVANADASDAAILNRKISVGPSNAYAYPGIFHGGIVALGDPGTDRANAKAWLAARAGITL